MRRQKPLSLSVGFEPPEYLLPFAGRPVRHFDRVVEAFVGAVVTLAPVAALSAVTGL
jgi:hypothetical protein